MRTVINTHAATIDFDVAVEIMDDELREALHNGDGDVSESNDSPGSEQEFFEWYCRLHFEKYGHEFEPNKTNPIW